MEKRDEPTARPPAHEIEADTLPALALSVVERRRATVDDGCTASGTSDGAVMIGVGAPGMASTTCTSGGRASALMVGVAAVDGGDRVAADPEQRGGHRGLSVGASGTVARTVAPSKKVTAPSAAPPLTVAVRLTGSPATDGLAVAVSTVAVERWPTSTAAPHGPAVGSLLASPA
jgi:hypothetical protein